MNVYVDNRIGGCPRYLLSEKPPRLPVVPEEVRMCVGYFCIRTENQGSHDDPRPGGTIFFVRHIEGGLGFTYAVTAKHNIEKGLASSRDGIIFLRLNLRFRLGFRYLETKEADWALHPHKSVDIAVIEIPIRPGEDDFDHMALPTGGFMDEKKIRDMQMGPTDPVVVAGLFSLSPGKNRNTPIFRTGTIAAMPDEPVFPSWCAPHGMDAYIIEMRSIRGISGSPVFSAPRGLSRRWIDVTTKEHIPATPDSPGIITDHLTINDDRREIYLVGAVHGHWEVEPDLIDLFPEQQNHELKMNAGLAMVVPASNILEVINLPRFAEKRAQVIVENRMAEGETVTD